VKLDRIKLVSIKNNETGKITQHFTKVMPFVDNVGVTLFGQANSEAISEMQEKGYDVYNEEDYCRLIESKLGLTEGVLGKRGQLWNTPKNREKYTVTVDGEEYSPALSEKALARAEAMSTRVSRVREPKMPEVLADKEDAMSFVASILRAQKKGFTDEVIRASVVSKVGEEKADKLMSIALNPLG